MNITGDVAVPIALIFAPFGIISAEAASPVLGVESPFTTVPASINRVSPAGTNI